MRKLGLIGVIGDIANRKRAAAQARFGRARPAGEEPRSAYLLACAEIAEAFTGDGFRFVKSIPALKRDSDSFAHQVWFQSSPNNVRGEHVALWIHVVVKSRELKSWRTMAGEKRATDFAAGGQIGNLEEPKGWSEWNVAIPEDRAFQIRDAVAAIRRVALPFLATFADRTTALATAATWPAPGLEIRQLIEFCLCLNERATAQALLDRYFQLRPDLLPIYTEALEQYFRSQPPDHWDAGSARDMAKLTVLHGLHTVSAV